jgi:hypothetical protein
MRSIRRCRIRLPFCNGFVARNGKPRARAFNRAETFASLPATIRESGPWGTRKAADGVRKTAATAAAMKKPPAVTSP